MSRAVVHQTQFDPETVYIFTDGSSKSVNGQWVGGWAAIMLYQGHRLEIGGGEIGATVNRMELLAIVEGMKQLKTGPQNVMIHSDSQYAVNCIVAWGHTWKSRGWVSRTGGAVANRELIEQAMGLLEPRMRLSWVKGHAKNPYNEAADRLAGEMMREAAATISGQITTKNGTVITEARIIAGLLTGIDQGGNIRVFSEDGSQAMLKITPEQARFIGNDLVRRSPAIIDPSVLLYPEAQEIAIERSKEAAIIAHEPVVAKARARVRPMQLS